MNPWKPMTNPIDLKHTGKTMEETSELISAVSRCQIQGLLESHPVTGKVNREWLKVSCPGGLDLELAQQLINAASGLEFLVTQNVAEGKVFTNSGFTFNRDSSLPEGVMEFRDEEGQVLRRLNKASGKKVVVGLDEEDEED